MRAYDVPLQSIKPGLQTQQLPNRYDPGRVNEMARQLADEGQKEPIILDATVTQIRDGFARYLAARQLSWRTIKASVMTDGEWKKSQELACFVAIGNDQRRQSFFRYPRRLPCGP